MKNIPQYTMLALIAFVSSSLAQAEYFSRNTGAVANIRDRYQYNLPVSSSNNTYNSSPTTPYSLNSLFGDEYTLRQYGQTEVPQYSKERDSNKSMLMEEDRAGAQQAAQPTAQAQPIRIPTGYG